MGGAVLLRRVVPEDASRMLAWMSDPAVAAGLGLRRAPSADYTAAWIEEAGRSDQVAAYAIEAEGEHVGNVVLDQIDAQVRCARFSIYIGESGRRGGGIGRAATALALERAFHDLDLQKVWLTVHVRNAAAIRLYAACGFSVEGVLRREFLLGGELVDVLRMAILSGEPTPA